MSFLINRYKEFGSNINFVCEKTIAETNFQPTVWLVLQGRNTKTQWRLWLTWLKILIFFLFFSSALFISHISFHFVFFFIFIKFVIFSSNSFLIFFLFFCLFSVIYRFFVNLLVQNLFLFALLRYLVSYILIKFLVFPLCWHDVHGDWLHQNKQNRFYQRHWRFHFSHFHCSAFYLFIKPYDHFSLLMYIFFSFVYFIFFHSFVFYCSFIC